MAMFINIVQIDLEEALHDKHLKILQMTSHCRGQITENILEL